MRKNIIWIGIAVGVIIIVVGLGIYKFIFTNNNTQLACTLEAKLCLDGSAVGRTGPNCEFAPCPQINAQPKTIITPTTTSAVIKNNNQTSTILSKVNLKIPFQPQAPFANWAEPYQNACEEASIIMVDHYLRGVGLSKQEMKDEIDQMIAWETQKWGYQKELTIEEIKIVAVAFYKYKIEIIPDLTIKKVKTQLSLGRPVIVPAAGRELGNPYYTSPGPIYHMLVIKGYDANGNFITNDPGTKNGADYAYNESVLMPAIHDWDGVNAAGPRVGLIMYK